MTATGSSFDGAHASELLRASGCKLGRPLAARARTGSTNDDALEAARAGAAHGAVLVADEQTRGRGRRGHAWHAGAGQDLTFSIVLRPALPLERVTALPLVAGLAVRAAAAARVEAPVGIKWPNDVLANGRKLAGILTESVLSAGKLRAVVVGVGVNVKTRDFPAELAAHATSLAALGAERLEREQLLADVLFELEPRLEAFERGGLATLEEELRRHDLLCGARVTVEGVSGVARGIDAQGALLVEDESGRRNAVIAGTVQVDR